MVSERLKQRPQLGRVARLHLDQKTQTYVLLSPERGLRLNETASEIVQRCTGQLTVREIVDELLKLTTADAEASRERVEADVLKLLTALEERRLLTFESDP